MLADLPRAASSDRATLRHPERTIYRCFLPDLTGFMGLCRAGPESSTPLARGRLGSDGPGEGIQPRCSGLRVQGTASSPPSTTTSRVYPGFPPEGQAGHNPSGAGSTFEPGERPRDYVRWPSGYRQTPPPRAAGRRLAGRRACAPWPGPYAGWPCPRPCCPAKSLSRATGAAIWLKPENLQRTGSYKVRRRVRPDPAPDPGAAPPGGDHGLRGQPRPGGGPGGGEPGRPRRGGDATQRPHRQVAATRDLGAEIVLVGESFEAAEAEAWPWRRSAG